MLKTAADFLVCFALFLACAFSGFAQSNSGTVHGSVLDPSGAAIASATVTIQNPVSHYSRSTVCNSQGIFEFGNVPYNNYHLTTAASGFQAAIEDINVRSAVPLELKISLAIGEETQTVTVEAGEDLVEATPTTHTDVDRGLFDKLPLESQSSSLSSAWSPWPPPESRPTRTGCFMDSAIMPRTRSRSTANRSPTSKARSSRIRSRSTPCSPWR